jgi:hypothetical protein
MVSADFRIFSRFNYVNGTPDLGKVMSISSFCKSGREFTRAFNSQSLLPISFFLYISTMSFW